MMENKSKYTKSLVLLAAGCGARTDTQGQDTPGSTGPGEAVSAELSEAEGSQEKENSADDGYELIYAEELETKEGSIPFRVWYSQELVTESYIEIDGQKLLVSPDLIGIGYAHLEPSVCDFTGDGKEEIALVISGGASGAVQAVQVFTSKDGEWTEMELPAGIYDNPPEFLEKKAGRNGI